MKRFKITAAICIFIVLSLMASGCSKKSISGRSVRLESGDITENSIVITIGNTGVKYSEVRNYCYLLKCQYEGIYGSKLWDYSIGEDTTIGDEAKQEVVNMITQLKVIKKTAQEQEITLTADERDEALQQAEELIEAAGETDKEEYCLSMQGLAELYEDNILAEKMFYIATDEADTRVSDDEARQADIQYIQIMTEGTDRNGNKVTMDAKTKDLTLKRVKKLRKEAVNADDFASFAQENTDSSQISVTIGKDSDVLGKEATDIALKMSKGDISSVVESSAGGNTGYYILYCANDNNEDATYKRKEEIIENRQTDMFKEKYAGWLEEADVNISQSFWEEFKI